MKKLVSVFLAVLLLSMTIINTSFAEGKTESSNDNVKYVAGYVAVAGILGYEWTYGNNITAEEAMAFIQEKAGRHSESMSFTKVEMGASESNGHSKSYTTTDDIGNETDGYSESNSSSFPQWGFGANESSSHGESYTTTDDIENETNGYSESYTTIGSYITFDDNGGTKVSPWGIGLNVSSNYNESQTLTDVEKQKIEQIYGYVPEEYEYQTEGHSSSTSNGLDMIGKQDSSASNGSSNSNKIRSKKDLEKQDFDIVDEISMIVGDSEENIRNEISESYKENERKRTITNDEMINEILTGEVYGDGSSVIIHKDINKNNSNPNVNTKKENNQKKDYNKNETKDSSQTGLKDFANNLTSGYTSKDYRNNVNKNDVIISDSEYITDGDYTETTGSTYDSLVERKKNSTTNKNVKTDGALQQITDTITASVKAIKTTITNVFSQMLKNNIK